MSPRTVEAEVLATNEAFYAAVESGDLDLLQGLSSTERELVCVHPGAEPIHGSGPVLRSWALIMANTDYIQFFLTGVEVSASGDLAVVTCTENILTPAGRPGGGEAAFRGGKAQAMNVFVKEATGWRLWIHQASPVGSAGI